MTTKLDAIQEDSISDIVNDPSQAASSFPDERMMPNDALRLLFYAIEDVMGMDGMKAVLHGAKLESYIDNYPPKNLDLGVKFSDYARAEQAVEEFYGPRAPRQCFNELDARP
jgi:hypothetical protein